MTTDDMKDAIQEAQIANFKATYGDTPGSVLAMVKAARPMFEHMYQDALDNLRDCNLAENGQGVQAQAQMLWTFLNLPMEISKMDGTVDPMS